MSAENFVAIIYDDKEDLFTGYHCFTEREYKKITDYEKFGTKIFECKAINEAVALANKEGCEYGFSFVNLPDLAPKKVSKHYVLDNGERCNCDECKSS